MWGNKTTGKDSMDSALVQWLCPEESGGEMVTLTSQRYVMVGATRQQTKTNKKTNTKKDIYIYISYSKLLWLADCILQKLDIWN